MAGGTGRMRFVFARPLIRPTMRSISSRRFLGGDRAVAIFAQDHPAGRRDGYGGLYAAPAVGAGTDERGDGAVTARIKRRGPNDDLGCCGLRVGDDVLRPVAIVLAVLCVWVDRRDISSA